MSDITEVPIFFLISTSLSDLLSKCVFYTIKFFYKHFFLTFSNKYTDKPNLEQNHFLNTMVCCF